MDVFKHLHNVQQVSVVNLVVTGAYALRKLWLVREVLCICLVGGLDFLAGEERKVILNAFLLP